MSYNSSTDHDEDVTQAIMESLSAALLVNPKFDFGKLMDLSSDVNSSKNKENLSDIITLSFLRHLGMDDAAETLKSENVAADMGFKALRLDDPDAMKWFTRFIAVMNPSLIASISQTLLSVVTGLMNQNIRSFDFERMENVKSKIGNLIETGELDKRIEDNQERKPESERRKNRENSNLGLLGWTAGVKYNKVKSYKNKSKQESRKSSSSSAKSPKSINAPPSEPESMRSLKEFLSDISVNDREVKPDESISNAGSSIKETRLTSANMKQVPISAKKKNVTIKSTESIISG